MSSKFALDLQALPLLGWSAELQINRDTSSQSLFSYVVISFFICVSAHAIILLADARRISFFQTLSNQATAVPFFVEQRMFLRSPARKGLHKLGVTNSSQYIMGAHQSTSSLRREISSADVTLGNPRSLALPPRAQAQHPPPPFQAAPSSPSALSLPASIPIPGDASLEDGDWEQYHGRHLEVPLRSGAIRLLRATWLIQQAAQDNVLQRRQDLPEAAFVATDDLLSWPANSQSLNVIVVSWCVYHLFEPAAVAILHFLALSKKPFKQLSRKVSSHACATQPLADLDTS